MYKALQASKKDRERALLTSVTGRWIAPAASSVGESTNTTGMLRRPGSVTARTKSGRRIPTTSSLAAKGDHTAVQVRAASPCANTYGLRRQVAASEDSESKAPEPRKSSVVRFAPVPSVTTLPSSESVAPEEPAAEAQGTASNGPTTLGKGWSALQKKGVGEVLAASTEGSVPEQRASVASLPSDMGGAGDEASPWANKSWLRRRRSSASTGASPGDESEFESKTRVGLSCFQGFLRLDRKKKKKNKRQSLQEHFYQVRGSSDG